MFGLVQLLMCCLRRVEQQGGTVAAFGGAHRVTWPFPAVEICGGRTIGICWDHSNSEASVIFTIGKLWEV